MTRPSPAEAFERLCALVAQLRGPDGCPWDREQTHSSLRTHLLEEAYEVADAISAGEDGNLRDELGDLLLQPVMHAQIAGEDNRFDIVDVLESISNKLVRRHPHVWGEVTVDNADEVLLNWDAIKLQEKADAASNRGADVPAPVASVLGGITRALPALSLALKVSKKAAKVGFEWPDVEAVMDKLREETDELQADLHNRERAAEELGDLLFTAVNVARRLHIDPELALRDTVDRFSARFAHMEHVSSKRGSNLGDLSPDQWESLWTEAKSR